MRKNIPGLRQCSRGDLSIGHSVCKITVCVSLERFARDVSPQRTIGCRYGLAARPCRHWCARSCVRLQFRYEIELDDASCLECSFRRGPWLPDNDDIAGRLSALTVEESFMPSWPERWRLNAHAMLQKSVQAWRLRLVRRRVLDRKGSQQNRQPFPARTHLQRPTDCLERRPGSDATRVSRAQRARHRPLEGMVRPQCSTQPGPVEPGFRSIQTVRRPYRPRNALPDRSLLSVIRLCVRWNSCAPPP